VRRTLEPALLRVVDRVVKQMQSVPSHDIQDTIGILKSHSEVADRLVSGTLSAQDVAKLTFDELLTDAERQAQKEKQERILKEIEDAGVGVGDLTDLFQCPECKGRKCRFKEQQTRGADEPTTKWIFCQNKDCKHSWVLE
jgi:transcription elongation factor S-II